MGSMSIVTLVSCDVSSLTHKSQMSSIPNMGPSPWWFTATYHDPVISGCCSSALQKGTCCRQYPSSRRFHWHRRRNTSVGLHLPSLFLPSCSLIGFFFLSYRRFLRARKFDLVQSKTMFAACQHWRRTVENVGIDELYREIDPFDVCLRIFLP